MLLLACGGAGIGMAWSSLTSSAVVWQRPASFAETEQQPGQSVDQFAAGRAWARAAFDGGLSRCPEMNADFVAGCEAEIKALKDRPRFGAGSDGGPLLITSYTPPAPRIEDEPALPTVEEEPPDLAQAPAPAPIPAMFEPTPDNYPAAPPEPQ